MDIYQYKQKYNIKLTKTVYNWLGKGYIAGAKPDDRGSWVIPNNARKPYCKRISKGVGLYKSIAKAVAENCEITHQRFDIDDITFQGYIEQLINAGIIEKFQIEGINYYRMTLQTEAFISWTNSQIAKFLQVTVGISVYGFASRYVPN